MKKVTVYITALLSICLWIGCGESTEVKPQEVDKPIPKGFYDDVVNEELTDLDRFVMLKKYISKRLKQETNRDTTIVDDKEIVIVGVDAKGDTIEHTRLDAVNLYLIEKIVYDECGVLIFEGLGEDINNYHVFKRKTLPSDPRYCGKKNFAKRAVYAFDDVGTLINISKFDYLKTDKQLKAAAKAAHEEVHK